MYVVACSWRVEIMRIPGLVAQRGDDPVQLDAGYPEDHLDALAHEGLHQRFAAAHRGHKCLLPLVRSGKVMSARTCQMARAYRTCRLVTLRGELRRTP